MILPYSSGLYFIPSSNFKKRNFSFCYHQSTANTPQAQSNRPSPVYMKGGFALYGETHPEHNPQFSFHRSASYSCFVTDLENTVKTKLLTVAFNSGSPSSKHGHRRASVLLRNIQNIRICMGKKPIVSVTYENERISIKNSLPYLKCVTSLLCGSRAVLWVFM